MIYDCFFSHQHDSLPLVEKIVEELEKIGFNCWYAPRNVKGAYAKAIADGINSSKVFVLLLNHKSAISESVLNEVEIAHNVSKNSPRAVIQPICIEKIDMNAPEYFEMMYYIRRMHFINSYENQNPAEISNEILKIQAQILGTKNKRKESKYVVQDIEDKRLELQNRILNRFDDDVYQRTLDEYASPNVLDVGCGQGDMLISKFGKRQIGTLVGVDKSSRQISSAKLRHTEENYHFFELDVESEDFENKLLAKINSVGVDKFDVINLSMLLLHLNDPAALLTKLRRFLSENGTVIIRDIDDGINFAFPDPENTFERIYQMCARDEQSGNRRNGRQIYTLLSTAEYTDIRLEHQGLSTVGMTADERDALFNMYFPFTLENAKAMMNKYPWNNDCKKDYMWFSQKFDDVHKAFSDPNFVFSLGFITYTAKNQK